MFGGVGAAHVKSLTSEHWDDYQLKSVSVGFGGNRKFYEFSKEYGIELMSHRDKYTHKASRYYYRKHIILLDDKPFTEKPPAKDIVEMVHR